MEMHSKQKEKVNIPKLNKGKLISQNLIRGSPAKSLYDALLQTPLSIFWHGGLVSYYYSSEMFSDAYQPLFQDPNTSLDLA